eukprot:COSAG06_NODE_69_length_26016_cov_6.603272_22_plen_119_part_00
MCCGGLSLERHPEVEPVEVNDGVSLEDRLDRGCSRPIPLLPHRTVQWVDVAWGPLSAIWIAAAHGGTGVGARSGSSPQSTPRECMSGAPKLHFLDGLSTLNRGKTSPAGEALKMPEAG